MPVTILKIEQEEAQGLKKFKIEQDAAVSEAIADNSEVLALNAGENSTQIVTEEQVLIVKPDDLMARIHAHSVQACISKDFIVTIDELRKLTIYSITQLEAGDLSAVRQFQLNKEVRSLSIASPDS